MAKKAIPAKVKAALFARDSHCKCCGTWDANHAGHVVAERNGGQAILENLVRMCETCNTSLGGFDAEFASYAHYTESRATIETNRAKWLTYVAMLRKYHTSQKNLDNGLTKRNPYKKPRPFEAV